MDISRLERLRKINLKIGYVVALALMLIAFSWTTERPPVTDPFDDLPMDDVLIIPPTHQEKVKELPPPPMQEKTKVQIDNQIIIESEKPELLSTEIAPKEPTPVLVETFNEPAPAPKPTEVPPPPKNKEASDIFVIVEHIPLFGNCNDNSFSKEEKKQCSEKALLGFIYKNIRYPSLARENGIQGLVHIQFVVEKDGSISGAKVMRDIGAGCGQEVLRVVNMMPKWTPGRQRTEEVRVQYNLPVKYSLE